VNEHQVRQALQEVLDEVAPGADLADVPADADLRRELDLDSLDFLNLVVALDERTGLRTKEADYPELTTIAGCLEFLNRHQVST
jgi:acyl carrier protein